MITIFSTHLVKRWVLVKQAKTKKVPTDIPMLCECIEQLNCYIPQILLDISSEDNVVNDYTYKLCTCAKLREIVSWIGSNIIRNLDKKNRNTCAVLLRIATDMLNKLYFNNVITKEENIYFHDNLVKNVFGLWDDLEKEKFPF